ncbi:MAG TPA: 3-hydroxyacyl-CoA dehydrogenase family protein, partial [Flavisolibacter sp.]|nr:3-hydroxyacyl-CoA dehydrogenase family protein [Flavisolibacter sp.]
MNTICICGAGTMGSGIAQVSAAAGFKTVLYDLSFEVVEKAKSKIEKDLQALVEKQKITSDKKESILRHIVFTNNINECIADVVIEAIIEKPEVKISLFSQLAAFNSDESIFATNTSSLSVSAIAKDVV